jgi:hypothetical protein
MASQSIPPIPAFFNVGPQVVDPGLASGSVLVIAPTVNKLGTPPPPTPSFFSVAPQFVDVGLAAGVALIIAAAAVDTGSSPTSEYLNGTHGLALYNAEALKSKFFPSARTPTASGKLGTFFNAGPQQYDFTTPSFYDAPQVKGNLPRVPTMVQAAPQQYDFTTQPFFDGFGPQPVVSSTPSVGAFVNVPPQQYDFTTQPFFDGGGPFSYPTQPVFISAAPQQYDFTLQPFYDGTGTQTPGSVPVTEATYGSHAVATYNAEALKSKIWASVAPSLVQTGKLSSSFNAGPQQYDFTQQPFYDAPQPSGSTSRVPTFTSAAPQQFDLTQQAFWDAPQPGGATTRVPTFINAAPQPLDLTQQAFWDAPQGGAPLAGEVPVSAWIGGTHAVALYNAEALKTKIWSSVSSGSVTGWVLTYISAGPDVTEYPTILGFTTSPAIPRAAFSTLGSFVSASPQFEERPTFVTRPAQRLGSTPLVPTMVSVGEQSYLNPPPSITHATLASGGPTLGTVVSVGQQSYTDVQPRYYPTVVVGNTPRVSAFFSVYPIDTSQLASWYTSSQPNPIGPVLRLVQAAPQSYDFTQQAFYDAPQPGPLHGPVPPLINSAPQQVDLTQQGSFSRPLIIGQGRLGAFVQTLPQKFDYTLPASLFQPLSARLVLVVRAPVRIELGDYGKRIELSTYGQRVELSSYQVRITSFTGEA